MYYMKKRNAGACCVSGLFYKLNCLHCGLPRAVVWTKTRCTKL